MRLIQDKTSIDFLSRGRRRIAIAISILVVVISLVSVATKGLEFGIDFTGGVLLEVGCAGAAIRYRNRSVGKTAATAER
jgi:preprotein translocase subunit SecF